MEPLQTPSLSPRRPVALVTGAGIRVGRAIAEALASDGYDLVLHANHSIGHLNTYVPILKHNGCHITIVQADLSRDSDVDRLADHIRKMVPALDALVHNAAIFEEKAFAEMARESWRKMLAINLEAPYFLTQQLLGCLRNAPSPSVIFLADIAGERPINRHSHYCISKAGVVMMTKSLALELGPHIRVNAIGPGTVAFPTDYSPEMQQALLKKIPLKREGSVDDVARAVRFLLQESYITGQMINIDGGRTVAL